MGVRVCVCDRMRAFAHANAHAPESLIKYNIFVMLCFVLQCIGLAFSGQNIMV